MALFGDLHDVFKASVWARIFFSFCKKSLPSSLQKKSGEPKIERLTTLPEPSRRNYPLLVLQYDNDIFNYGFSRNFVGAISSRIEAFLFLTSFFCSLFLVAFCDLSDVTDDKWSVIIDEASSALSWVVNTYSFYSTRFATQTIVDFFMPRHSVEDLSVSLSTFSVITSILDFFLEDN